MNIQQKFPAVATLALVLSGCVDQSRTPKFNESAWTGAEGSGKLPGKVLVIPPGHVAHTKYPDNWTASFLDPLNSEERLSSKPVTTQQKDSTENISIYNLGDGETTIVNKYGPISVNYFADLKVLKEKKLNPERNVIEVCNLINKHFGDYDTETSNWLSGQTATRKIIKILEEEIQNLPSLPNGTIDPKDLGVFNSNIDFIPVERIKQLTGYPDLGQILKSFRKNILDRINLNIPESLKSVSDLNTGIELLNWAHTNQLIDSDTFTKIAKNEDGNRHDTLVQIAKGRILTEMLLTHALVISEEHLETLQTATPDSVKKTNQEVDKIGYGNLICKHFAPLLKDGLSYLGIESQLILGRLDPESSDDTFHLFVYIPKIHSIGEATTHGEESLKKINEVQWLSNPLCKTATGSYEFIRLSLQEEQNNTLPNTSSIIMKMLLKSGQDPDFWQNHGVVFNRGNLYIVPNDEEQKFIKHPMSQRGIWTLPESSGPATLKPAETFYLPKKKVEFKDPLGIFTK